ncbi:hypothetical protein ES703_96290 [subsurface metagenome]
MVDVQQSPLGTFEKNRIPLFYLLIQKKRNIFDVFSDFCCVSRVFLVHGLRVQERFAEVGEIDILDVDVFLYLFLQDREIQKIPHPDSPPRHFIFIGRADPAERGPYHFFASSLLTDFLDERMIRKNEVGIPADRDIVVNLHSVFSELFDFL